MKKASLNLLCSCLLLVVLVACTASVPSEIEEELIQKQNRWLTSGYPAWTIESTEVTYKGNAKLTNLEKARYDMAICYEVTTIGLNGSGEPDTYVDFGMVVKNGDIWERRPVVGRDDQRCAGNW